VASGILSEREAEVANAAAATGVLAPLRRLEREGWCGLAFARA
jgi:ribosomal protein L11 methylase PrmA